jgi:hypothetical protein
MTTFFLNLVMQVFGAFFNANNYPVALTIEHMCVKYRFNMANLHSNYFKVTTMTVTRASQQKGLNLMFSTCFISGPIVCPPLALL